TIPQHSVKPGRHIQDGQRACDDGHVKVGGATLHDPSILGAARGAWLFDLGLSPSARPRATVCTTEVLTVATHRAFDRDMSQRATAAAPYIMIRAAGPTRRVYDPS